MEHAAMYSLILFVTLTPGLNWCYRRKRAMHRIERGLRFYLGHTA